MKEKGRVRRQREMSGIEMKKGESGETGIRERRDKGKERDKRRKKKGRMEKQG